MERPPPEIVELYEKALGYDERGDVYSAIKLYKKIVKLAPAWPPPFQRLGSIYKYRREWKPALHFFKKAVALDSGDRASWWDLGIAATALNKGRIARSVWSKFGQTPEAGWRPSAVSLRVAYEGQYEILWADAVDPARAIIQNIPNPASGRHFRDTVLIDRVVSGHHVVRNKRYAVYDELGLYKGSGYLTYSCTLTTEGYQEVQLLEKICLEAGLGFEVWSGAARQYSPRLSRATPEYYSPGLLEERCADGVLVALAAQRERHVLQALRSWEVISLRSFSDLRRH
jgi:tetratricopeptide (TPR) repeat protein